MHTSFWVINIKHDTCVAICKLSKKSKVSNIQMVFIHEFSSAFPPNKQTFAHISLTAHILGSTGDVLFLSFMETK